MNRRPTHVVVPTPRGDAEKRSAVRTTSLPVPAPAPAPERRRDGRWSPGWAVVALAAGVHLALCWLFRGFITDDAWISVRYAENLADGNGFVWNPGGPRAEGFSNPLLVALEAVAHAAGWSAPGAARGLGGRSEERRAG